MHLWKKYKKAAEVCSFAIIKLTAINFDFKASSLASNRASNSFSTISNLQPFTSTTNPKPPFQISPQRSS